MLTQMTKLKARGMQDSWFATVEGEELPCAWNHWGTNVHYLDERVETTNLKWPKYLKAITNGKRIILTKKDLSNSGGNSKNWSGRGYIALFRIDNVALTDSPRWQLGLNRQNRGRRCWFVHAQQKPRHPSPVRSAAFIGIFGKYTGLRWMLCAEFSPLRRRGPKSIWRSGHA
jgi:hypothetical protein